MNNIPFYPGLPCVSKTPTKNVPTPNHCVFVVTTMTATKSINSNLLSTALKPIDNVTTDSKLQSIRTNHTKININAAYVFTPIGDGLHGHLDIYMTADKYSNTTPTTYFFLPVNPTTAPVHISTATTAQIYETIRLHGENHRTLQL